MAQSSSLTSFVMEHRLPWAAGSSAAPAGAGRFDPAFMIHAGHRRACTIRSLSPLGATVTGELATREGEELVLELVTGQRPAGTVEFVGRGEAGVRFKHPIDVLALINRTLISQPTERRSMPRVELRCGVRLKWGGSVCDAILRNISARGMQVEAGGLPPRGTYVSIHIGRAQRSVRRGHVAQEQGRWHPVDRRAAMDLADAVDSKRQRLTGGGVDQVDGDHSVRRVTAAASSAFCL